MAVKIPAAVIEPVAVHSRGESVTVTISRGNPSCLVELVTAFTSMTPGFWHGNYSVCHNSNAKRSNDDQYAEIIKSGFDAEHRHTELLLLHLENKIIFNLGKKKPR